MYMLDALPKEVRYVISGLQQVDAAWARLDERYGDPQQRVRLIYEKLTKLELRGKDFERVEKLYFEVEQAEAMLAATGARNRLEQDMYIVSILLSKLDPASTREWYKYAEEQPGHVTNGVNEWQSFKTWLHKGYRLAQRVRLGVTPASRAPTANPKAPPPKPMCTKCRGIGHRAADCDVESPRAFVADGEASEDDQEHREVAFASDAERVSKYKDAEKRFGRCPFCKEAHTYRRKVGDEVMDWPS